LLSSVLEWSGLIFGTNGFISCIWILVQTLCETSSARFLGQSFLLNLVERHCKKRLSDGKWRLAGYTEENPKISTACGHHFHLACIYGWMEYSKHCPMCDKVMSVLISAHTVFLLPCSLLVGPSLHQSWPASDLLNELHRKAKFQQVLQRVGSMLQIRVA
jgi:hypothetical protein